MSKMIFRVLPFPYLNLKYLPFPHSFMFVSCCVKCLVSDLVDSPNNVINFLFSNFYINEISTLHGPGVRL